MDEAALAAARQWVLRPADRPAEGARLRVPVAFDVTRAKAQRYVDADWPRSHRRARYVVDTLPGYDTPQQVLGRYPLDPEAMITPPYRHVRNVFFRQRGADPAEYWLFLYLGQTQVAARYRLGMEGDDAVVYLAVVCSSEPKECERDRRWLMRGLPPMVPQ